MVKVKPCPHVHAVGALVHQAAQARPLKARFVGGLGSFELVKALQPDGRAGKAAAARRAGWPGLSQYQQLIRTFCFTKQKT